MIFKHVLNKRSSGAVHKSEPCVHFPAFIPVFFLLPFGCGGPLVWNADLKTFVDEGTSIISLDGFTLDNDGITVTMIPSGSRAVVYLEIANPRSLEISCTPGWTDGSLFDSVPQAAVINPGQISLAFTPGFAAEHKNLVITLQFAAPTIGRTYAPVDITLYCNSAPGGVKSSLDAALGTDGAAFAAFRLPSEPTDNDLSGVEISYWRADDTGTRESVTLGVDDASLYQKRLCVNGGDLLGTDNPLNRYYRPSDISSGDDYAFSIVVIDADGLRSQAAMITSNSTLYTVIYDGNGNTGGTVPADLFSYRQTKPVTVLGSGTMVRSGYTLLGWNTAADGSGTGYGPGQTFSMPAADVTLYAQWTINSYTVSFDSRGGNSVSSVTQQYETTFALPAAVRTGYTFTGWNTAADGSGTGYAAGDVFTFPAGDAALYAQWMVNNYTVSFNSQGGDTVTAVTQEYSSSFGLPGTVRTGYTLLGWNTAADGSGTGYGPGQTFSMPAADVTLYAQWIQNDSIIINFILNPAFGVITFDNPGVIVPRGNTLMLSTTITGAVNWHWYIDNQLIGPQADSTFSWNTSGVQPGQYIINADAVYGGYSCTGSIRVTVTY